MKVVSMRGMPLDMGRYLAMHEGQVAVGNGKMNARGDLIGRGGGIVTPREQVAQEYHRANPKAVRNVSLKDISAEVMASPAEALEMAIKDAQSGKAAEVASPYMSKGPAAVPMPTGRKRKISDGD